MIFLLNLILCTLAAAIYNEFEKSTFVFVCIVTLIVCAAHSENIIDFFKKDDL